MYYPSITIQLMARITRLSATTPAFFDGSSCSFASHHYSTLSTRFMSPLFLVCCRSLFLCPCLVLSSSSPSLPATTNSHPGFLQASVKILNKPNSDRKFTHPLSTPRQRALYYFPLPCHFLQTLPKHSASAFLLFNQGTNLSRDLVIFSLGFRSRTNFDY